jgi:hypothetical protein
MNKSVLICLLFCSLTINTVLANVTVVVNQKQYIFAHSPRLVEILTPIAAQQNWYWPGVTLYETDDSQLEVERQLLIDNLTSLIKRYQTEKPDTASALEQLQVSVLSWRLARRFPIKIDYDLARVVAAANPQLPPGKYILDIKSRMHTVQLFGAINKTATLPHLPHADVSEYIISQNLTDLANKDIVTIIQADGRKITAPVAYWNKTHQEVMPGSQIFVPFKQSIFQPELATINQKIINLALNRVQQ